MALSVALGAGRSRKSRLLLLSVCVSHRYVIRQMVGIYYTEVDIGLASGGGTVNQFAIGLCVLDMSHERA